MLNIAIYQLVTPKYRIPFFNKLAKRKEYNLSIHSGKYLKGKPVSDFKNLKCRLFETKVISFFNGMFFWQRFDIIPKYLQANDIIILEGNFRILSNFLLLFQAKKKGIKVVWWSHGLTEDSAMWLVLFKKKFSEYINGLLLYTEKEVNTLSNFQFEANKLFYTNNTIDTSGYLSEKAKWSDRKLLSFKKKHDLYNKLTLLFCGRLTKKAELKIGLQAFSKLVKKNKQYKFVIIGVGEELSRSKSLSQQLGLENNIIWVGEVYNQKDLTPWFLSADLFLYPGSIGLSIFDAFCNSLPVITHNNDKIQMPEFDAIKNGKNGLLYQHGNKSDLIKKIEKLANSILLRNYLSKKALETSKREYNIDIMVSQFFNMIKILNKK